ncbi:MAG TPA: DUF423 domain-containing protein [Opitutaceae bacterium]|nr:DUF423 domain-containing protein [Opitutaceae bacterium]
MSSRSAFIFSALAGFTAVALGAFGAHALKERLAAAAMTSVWDKAVLYHLVHAVAIFAASLTLANESRAGSPWLGRAVGAWLFGILLFSGSLYALALGGPRWTGFITPFGGLSFLAGWLFVGLHGRNRMSSLAE